VPAGIASGDGGRRARDRHQLVGWQAEAEVRAEVRVQIDEAGRHEPAGHVDALHAAVDRNARCDGRDLAIADPDVALATQLLARIEHVAVGDDQLVLERGVGRIEAARRGCAARLRHVHGHLRVGGAGERAAGGGGAAGGQEVAT
jgi:hypothetical protein